MKYKVLRSVIYTPSGFPAQHFEPGDILDTDKLPTVMPIEQLLADGAIEPLKPAKKKGGQHG